MRLPDFMLTPPDPDAGPRRVVDTADLCTECGEFDGHHPRCGLRPDDSDADDDREPTDPEEL